MLVFPWSIKFNPLKTIFIELAVSTKLGEKKQFLIYKYVSYELKRKTLLNYFTIIFVDIHKKNNLEGTNSKLLNLSFKSFKKLAWKHLETVHLKVRTNKPFQLQ